MKFIKFDFSLYFEHTKHLSLPQKAIFFDLIILICKSRNETLPFDDQSVDRIKFAVFGRRDILKEDSNDFEFVINNCFIEDADKKTISHEWSTELINSFSQRSLINQKSSLSRNTLKSKKNNDKAINPNFLEIYNLYPKKRNKKKCILLMQNLSEDALKILKKYVEDNKDLFIRDYSDNNYKFLSNLENVILNETYLEKKKINSNQVINILAGAK